MVGRERVLDRLTKLLALAGSPNGHEAATAGRIAEGIMREHGLTRGDVEEHTSSGIHELSMGAKGFEHAWKWALVTAVARYCGCEAVSLIAAGRRKVRLVGERADVEWADSLFRDILASFARLERVEAVEIERSDRCVSSTPEEYVDSYRRGMTVAVADLMSRASSGAPVERRSPVVDDVGPASPEVPQKKPKWYKKLWSRDGNEAAARSPEEERGLAVVVAKKSDPRERVEARYAPKRTSARLSDAADDDAFERGYDAATMRIVLPPRSESPPATRRKSKMSG